MIRHQVIGIAALGLSLVSCTGGAAPVTVPTGSPPTASTSPGPAEAHAWEPVGSLTGLDRVVDLVGFEGGYIALPEVSEPPAEASVEVSISSDGRSWRSVPLPAPEPIESPDGELRERPAAVALATDGRSVLVVGGYPHEPCDWTPDTGGPPPCIGSPISWITTDGTTWRSSMPWVGPLSSPGEQPPKGSGFLAAWAVPDGWEAALGYVSGIVVGMREIWHSDDGVTWTKAADVIGSDSPPFAIVAPDGRRVIGMPLYEGGGEAPALWTSADGTTWRRVAGPQNATWITDGIAQAADGEPWLVVGRSSDRGAAGWRSAGLASWVEVELPATGAAPSAVASAASISVVTGVAGDVDVQTGTTWVSHDRTTWELVPGAPVIAALADGPAGMLGTGPAGEGQYQVFVLR